MHRYGCRQAFWVDHSMLHRVLKGVDGLPGRLPWTDMSGWTPLPPAPSRERAKPAPWYDIPANSSCKGGSPVLICLGCPPGSAHRCSSERLHANRGLHSVATLQHTQLEPAPAARWPHMHPVSTSTCRHSYPGSAPQLQHMLATAGSRCAKPWRQWAPLLHRQRPGRRCRQAAAASAQASQVSHERDARPVNHVSCAHTDPCTCFIHLQPEQEQQTQSGQAALHSSAPWCSTLAAATGASCWPSGGWVGEGGHGQGRSWRAGAWMAASVSVLCARGWRQCVDCCPCLCPCCCCLLPAACSLLPAACSLLPAPCCLLPAPCCR